MNGKLLSPAQVAERLGVSRDTIYRRAGEWGLTPHRIGRQIRFKESDVEAMLKGDV
jgi:excisionase family DNA binding protein